jgi:hypothetical protein
MEDPIRISLAPGTMVSLWLGAVPPMAAGLAAGGPAAAVGAGFAAACPLLVASGARWPVRAPRLFPVYFGALFLIALTAFEFNSVAFVVDTWSALLLGVLTIPVARTEQIDAVAVAGPPTARRRAPAGPWTARGSSESLRELGSRRWDRAFLPSEAE